MAKREPLKVRGFIKDTETGLIHSWDDMPEEQKAIYRKKMTENSRRGMTAYYTAHPDEFEKLPQ